jgi:D-glycero-D-manno-heptose 1,7-bisphosphate phosphatase
LWRLRRICERRSSSRSRPSSGTRWCRTRRSHSSRDTGRRSRIGRPAAFFDRDGVVNELVPDPLSGLPESPLDPDDVALIPGAAAALRRLRDAGYLLVAVSNQPAAAKGVVTLERLRAVQERVLDLLRHEGIVPDAIRCCFHHPEATMPELRTMCRCRKPAPGMLLDAAAELDVDLGASWMIGDTDRDVAAGAAAGCRTILIAAPGSVHKRSGTARADVHAPDVTAAVDAILATLAA